jgi:hypothetical protein
MRDIAEGGDLSTLREVNTAETMQRLATEEPAAGE